MSQAMALLTVFVLAVFVGFEVIAKVSSVLHTPLMSGANAIQGVILIGAVIATGTATGTFCTSCWAWRPSCSPPSTSSVGSS